MKEVLKKGAGFTIMGSWLTISLFLVLAAGLMSVDEESQGWSDVLLNPYIMLPYIAVTGLGATALWLLFRERS